ncbi:Putative NADPH-dependent methylglyoxal reductase [Clavispora lusitaniae]|uniref:NADPH-dependent methylglyoxal reductase n=1 Tax=Clavispora lusitaniae TaxID=36911 RepID=A0ACD0WFM0_CLALS|nr:Putative NADPH-dependent methylglyoxal reductase [Clavispora lusitaniae]QFZ31945.1 Putative NADPH-dependent methylglyoxal reductase [Clavispora lusitaniae]QFZ37614.1 Putative NADPH-dependent methylglyoxal reductase [Clavispora lusitaniae]QFZ43298.1 Putative NADPH-dependent methylglyoxal reductase [Clavispora lusitaniae]QFZ48974.1 Putative NADPH-dependent methylglyoxal reductase [Clavispora lusitaniae]
MTQVFLTGANGYIGAQIAKHLIDKGYEVIGSVRSAKKGDKLKSHLGANFTYEVVPSFVEEGAFDEALKKHPEVVAFLHSASPVIFESSDPENDVLLPAIQGTQNALKAAQKHGPNIRKFFVYTSSVAAMHHLSEAAHVTEKSWNPITYEAAKTEPNGLYQGSKTFAEKAAWKFIESEKPSFTLTTVSPVFTFGPLAFDEDAATNSFSSTSTIIPLVLNTKKGGKLPDFKGSAVHVKDVAKLHIAAIENDNLAGKRLIACSAYWDIQILLEFIQKNYPELAKDLPEGNPGSSEEARKTAPTFDNSETTRLVGIEWIPVETAFKDALDQIIRTRG